MAQQLPKRCKLVSSSSPQSGHRGSSILLNKVRCRFKVLCPMGPAFKGHLKVTWSDAVRLVTYDFLAIHINYRTILHRFQDTWQHWFRIATFYPSYFSHPCEGTSMGILQCHSAQKTKMEGQLYGEKVWWFIQLSVNATPERDTDREFLYQYCVSVR